MTSSRFHPGKLFIRTRFNYEKLPHDGQASPPLPLFSSKSWSSKAARPAWANRIQRPRLSLARLVALAVTVIVLASMLGTGIYRRHRWHAQQHQGEDRKQYHWEHYPRLNGFFNGIRTLVPYGDYVSEQDFVKYSQSSDPEDNIKPKWPHMAKDNKEPPLDPVPFDPYKFDSAEYLKDHDKPEPCYLDEDEKIDLPDIYAYPGIPQNMTAPFFGSYEELGMDDKKCFDRFGRFGPYGYSYSREEGGLDMAGKSEQAGADKIWSYEKKVDYRKVNWAAAQKRCYQKNLHRFTTNATAGDESASGKKKIKRHAYILRTWTGYKYSDYQILTLRAMINELALKSGGEYDVHFLLHVKMTAFPSGRRRRFTKR